MIGVPANREIKTLNGRQRMKRTLLAAIAAFVTLTAIGVVKYRNFRCGACRKCPSGSTRSSGTPGKPLPEASAVDQDAPYFEACAREGLNQSECVGRLIWFKATAGNDRFHTYVFQQRIGVLVDWFPRTAQRSTR